MGHARKYQVAGGPPTATHQCKRLRQAPCPTEDPLQWRHNERDDVTNHRSLDRLLNRLFRRRLKKTSKLRVTGLYEGNSPVTGGFLSQRASNPENVSIWWRHHVSGYVGLVVSCWLCYSFIAISISSVLLPSLMRTWEFLGYVVLAIITEIEFVVIIKNDFHKIKDDQYFSSLLINAIRWCEIIEKMFLNY